jgi:GH25 family lysozyme M1 (1,4-beta-N-acetylmuramidase)
MTYTLVIDCWEGSGLIKADAVPASGIIVRINEMAGGHHLDAGFIAQWDEAQKFKAWSLYFVYNPWVSGAENFNWLKSNEPANTPLRIFLDHELTYSGSPPSQMTPQFFNFYQRVIDWGHVPTIYSGAWFVPSMTAWPKGEYWWMWYPFAFQEANWSTWEQVKAAIDGYAWPAVALAQCPGTVRLWQACSNQAAVGLPGCNHHDVDINVWPGDLASLQEWFGNKVTAPQYHTYLPIMHA